MQVRQHRSTLPTHPLFCSNIPVPGISSSAAVRKAIPSVPSPSGVPAAVPSTVSSALAAVPRAERQQHQQDLPTGKAGQETDKTQQKINAASHRAQEYVAELRQELQAKKKKAAAADPGWTQVSGRRGPWGERWICRPPHASSGG